MPVGDLPGWKEIFSDDFLTDAPLGSFPGTLYPGWTAYPDTYHDTSGNGQYSPERTLSVQGGVLHINVHTENGVHYSSAPEPMKGQGQIYGRYAIRFRATQMTNDYKAAWLLWPDSDVWPADGEIDYPEGGLASTFSAFAHYASAAGGQDAFDTMTTFAAWHTAVTEWAPTGVSFYLDGTLLGTSTTEVPSKAMHFVLQTETRLSGGPPSNTSVGELQVDWVAIWAKI